MNGWDDGAFRRTQAHDHPVRRRLGYARLMEQDEAATLAATGPIVQRAPDRREASCSGFTEQPPGRRDDFRRLAD
jgi:hypothetical protein